MPEEERRISPGVVVAGVGLAGLGALALAAMALAAPPVVFTCPHCGATFATQEELNYHIQTEHPEVPPVAEFEVSNLVIYPPEVAVGETVTIACTVTNIGGEAGSHTVYLGGDFAAQQIVTLQPGESRIVSFEVTPEVARSYSVSVDGLYGTFVATEMPVADIRVENLVISPTEPMVGEIVTISVTVTNIGGEAGSHTVYLGGDFAAQQIVTLQPGESRIVSFEVTPEVAKTYSVSVDGLYGSFRATEVG
ncbi:unnamed protein product, partial [marine sediment metagenome]